MVLSIFVQKKYFLAHMKNAGLCNYHCLDGWPVLLTNFNIVIFLDTVGARSFKLCMIMTLAWGLPIYTRFVDIGFVSR